MANKIILLCAEAQSACISAVGFRAALEDMSDFQIQHLERKEKFDIQEFKHFPVDINTKTKGKHPQPFYRKGRW